jgi:hypothetical protein
MAGLIRVLVVVGGLGLAAALIVKGPATRPPAKPDSLAETCNRYSAKEWRKDLAPFPITTYGRSYAIEVDERAWSLVKHDARIRLALTVACLTYREKGENDGYVISDTSHDILGRVIDGNYSN